MIIQPEWEESTVTNLLLAIRKVTSAETKRLEQPHRP